jgi:hypothetical protein
LILSCAEVIKEEVVVNDVDQVLEVTPALILINRIVKEKLDKAGIEGLGVL